MHYHSGEGYKTCKQCCSDKKHSRKIKAGEKVIKNTYIEGLECINCGFEYGIVNLHDWIYQHQTPQLFCCPHDYDVGDLSE